MFLLTFSVVFFPSSSSTFDKVDNKYADDNYRFLSRSVDFFGCFSELTGNLYCTLNSIINLN